MFTCPNCQRTVGEYPEGGTITAVCANCTFKYELTGGSTTGFTSREVEVSPATQGQHARYARAFELTVATVPRESVRFTFGSDREDDWIRVARGDRVVVVYSMRGDEREELLFVVNRTSGERFVLGTPGARSKKQAIAFGALATVLGGGAAMAFAAPAIAVLAVAAVAGAGTAAVLSRTLKPRHDIAQSDRMLLSARQDLLEEKRKLLALRERVRDEIESRGRLDERLSGLRSRMQAVGAGTYATRIQAIDDALATLRQQLEVDAQLMIEYERTLQIIEIEYESSLAVDSIPADGATVLEARLAELHAAEERRAETTRQLAANAEVEQLLRAHSG